MSAPAATVAILAVDGGNSKTDVALIAPDGRLLAALRGPTTSHQQVGLETGADRLAELVREAREAGGLPQPASVAEVAVYALAGADTPADDRRLTHALGARHPAGAAPGAIAGRVRRLRGWRSSRAIDRRSAGRRARRHGAGDHPPAVADSASATGGAGRRHLRGPRRTLRGTHPRGHRGRCTRRRRAALGGLAGARGSAARPGPSTWAGRGRAAHCGGAAARRARHLAAGPEHAHDGGRSRGRLDVVGRRMGRLGAMLR